MLNDKIIKRILIIIGVLVCIAAAEVVMGQTIDGVITYEVKVNLHRRIPPGQEARKSMIPEFRTTKQQLFFNANESMYKALIEDDTAGDIEQSGPVLYGELYLRPQQATQSDGRWTEGRRDAHDEHGPLSPFSQRQDSLSL